MLHLAPRIRSLRFLCVEEDEVQRKLLSACLDVVGAEALFATGARDAVTLFRRHPVDLVLMDIDLHSAEELAAFEAMRAVPHRGRGVPVLAVTNNDCGWTEESYREVGFAGLFLKPVEPVRLFRVIDQVLCEAGQPPLLEESERTLRAGASFAFV
jgi:CheY-like chemotaxis protein